MIREARLDDLEQIEHLERECFPEPWSRRLIESELVAHDRINLVWSEGDSILGYVLAMQVLDDLHINKIGTTAQARRRGVAGSLMAAVAAIARDRGGRLISLEVRRTNEPARVFYESLGFSIEYVRRNYYPSGEDALVMSRAIPADSENDEPLNRS